MTSGNTGQDASREAQADYSAESDEAIEVLRGVWNANGQTGEDLAELFGEPKSCKSMENVGFDALAGTNGDLRSAWRATLEREGKLSPRAGSVRDLVLGSAEPGER